LAGRSPAPCLAAAHRNKPSAQSALKIARAPFGDDGNRLRRRIEHLGFLHHAVLIVAADDKDSAVSQRRRRMISPSHM
jgi:hypothetical protein